MQTDFRERRSPPGATAGFKNADLGGQRRNLTTVPLAAATLATRRKYAPFAREIADLIACGGAPNVYVFAGDGAWDRAARRRSIHGPGSAAVMPADVEPEALRWPAGIDALCLVAFGLPRAHVIRMAQAIVTAGIRCVMVTGEFPAIVRSALPGGAH